MYRANHYYNIPAIKGIAENLTAAFFPDREQLLREQTQKFNLEQAMASADREAEGRQALGDLVANMAPERAPLGQAILKGVDPDILKLVDPSFAATVLNAEGRLTVPQQHDRDETLHGYDLSRDDNQFGHRRTLQDDQQGFLSGQNSLDRSLKVSLADRDAEDAMERLVYGQKRAEYQQAGEIGSREQALATRGQQAMDQIDRRGGIDQATEDLRSDNRIREARERARIEQEYGAPGATGSGLADIVQPEPLDVLASKRIAEIARPYLIGLGLDNEQQQAIAVSRMERLYTQGVPLNEAVNRVLSQIEDPWFGGPRITGGDRIRVDDAGNLIK